MKKHFLLIFTALLMGFSAVESFAQISYSGPIIPVPPVPLGYVNMKIEPRYFEASPPPTKPAFYTWGIKTPGTLPPGLTLNQLGVLSGMPSKNGTYTFIVVCKNATAPVASKRYTVKIETKEFPKIMSPISLLPGQMDVPYVQGTGGVSFNATGGVRFLPTPDKPTGYNWKLSVGKIPTGMTFNTVGALSGIPVLDRKLSGNFTQPQTFTFNITATDAVLGNNTKTFTLKINPPEKPEILTDCPLPDGYQGALYPIVFLKAVKGKKEYSWSVSRRTPPPTFLGANEFNRFPDGLKLSKAGAISGTPILHGKFFFRLTVTDANGLSVEKDCSITIIPAPSIPDTEFPTCWTANKSIDQFCLTAKDGKPGYTWAIVGESLPKDLVIDKNTGCITGVCKQSGNFSVIVKVTDKNGVSTEKTFPVKVHAPLVITTTCPLPDGDVGKPYSAYLTATGGKQPYTWKIFPQIYISDYSNNVIRKFSEKGNVTTFAGNGNSASVDGTLTTSSFQNPYGIGFDPNGNIYVADYTSGKIRKISSSGSVTTLPGTFGSPEDMVADSSGNVYVSSTSDNSIWKTKEGGTASQLTSSALINFPQGICWDWDGDMILANYGANNILKINPSGTPVSIVAGSPEAGLSTPHDVKVDFAGNIYVADSGNYAIKKITPTGEASTLASCEYGAPVCLSVDNQGYVYFTNAVLNKIMKASPTGTVTRIAGTGAAGLQNGPALSATFNSPHSVDVNPYEDLPRGLKLNPDTGEISGTPEQPGLYKIIYEVTDACENVATKNCTIKVEPLILNCAKEIWVVVDYCPDGTHACNHAVYDIFANNQMIMTANLNNVGGSNDWADDRNGVPTRPATFIVPHEDCSSTVHWTPAGPRYNRVLISGSQLIAVAAGSTNGNINITASCNSSLSDSGTCTHTCASGGVGRLRVYVTNATTGVFSNSWNPVYDSNVSGKFCSETATTVNVCANATVNPVPGFTHLSAPSLKARDQTCRIDAKRTLPNASAIVLAKTDHLVAMPFLIGKNEVTNQEYCVFLNAVAKNSDPRGLYNFAMGSALNGGILQTGNAGAYSYTVKPGMGDYPVVYVSWFDAARYVNWLSNGSPTGLQDKTTTEDGTYALNGAVSGVSIVRNATNPNTKLKPTKWLLNESEWFTSAYLKSSKLTSVSFWNYPTQSDTPPDLKLANPKNLANYGNIFDGPTEAGFFSDSPSAFGTFDQGGNVREWTESVDSTKYRIIRGGSWADSADAMKASESDVSDPTLEDDKTGFRIGGAP